MATADEILAQLGNAKTQAAEAQAETQQAGSTVTEFGHNMQAFGVDDKAQIAHTCADQLNRAQTLITQGLAALEQAEATAIRLKGAGLNPANPPPPAQPREPAAKIGDPVTAPEPAPGNLQKELANPDDGDKTRNKFARSARAAVRNVGDLKDQAQDTAKSAHASMGSVYRPPEGPTYETVGMPDPAARYEPPGHVKADADNHAGSMVVLAVLVTEWGSRMVKDRKARRNDN
ncbi:MAG: hypothetical protein ACRDXX_01885 [Stackebrandtia sp.]